jgi:phage shock protein PspC (stress-responsive transcriptional regulator)
LEEKMNGTSRLYRSTSEAMLGGVAAGLGNYFKIDPVVVRIAFVLLTIFTSGAFLLVYLAMWLLVPTPASTATQPGQVVQENLNEMGARVRGLVGMNGGNGGSSNPAGNGSNGNPANPANPANGGTNGAPNGTNMVPAQSNATYRPSIAPVILIGLGLLFLFGNMGFFRLIIWHAWWPLFLIAIGVLLLTRRNR